MDKSKIDTAKLRELIHQFKFHTTPSNADPSHPCTVKDIRNVIDNVTKLLNAFVDELENSNN
ncbi:MAG: hypothetical protein K2O14_06190 [Oscillospiraceae bacterium]|nr:hypothetical protein [Oscillospiraceae bacterium]